MFAQTQYFPQTQHTQNTTQISSIENELNSIKYKRGSIKHSIHSRNIPKSPRPITRAKILLKEVFDNINNMAML